MSFNGKRLLLLVLQFYFIVSVYGGNVKTLEISGKTLTKSNLVDKTLKLLSKLECCVELNRDITFAALLSDFLIKQKVRFYEPTRYEEQVYFHILHKLSNVIQKAHAMNLEHSTRILANVFQKNVLLLFTNLRPGQIDTHFEYQSISKDYVQLLESGFPNKTLSDECLADIVSLEQCENLRADCLDVITSDLPNFGYRRMHQILLLYVFMHHKCAQHFGSKLAYDIMASERCSQVYREQKVLENVLGLPIIYKDLYLEQNAICGLFGYEEFLNWHILDKLVNWSNVQGCYCMLLPFEHKLNCDCANHLNSLALVYYINALLLLD